MAVVILVDQSNIFYRAYYSGKKHHTIHPWLPIVRYFSILKKAAVMVKAKYKDPNISFIFAGDSLTKLKRTEFDSTYKANRSPSKDDVFINFRKAIDKIHDVLDLPLVRLDGLEGDDVIASLVQNNVFNTNRMVIMSDDKDLRQLLHFKYVSIYAPGRGFYTIEDFVEEYELQPDRFVFYKALLGDTSDNIAGVYGWGPVRAKEAIIAGTWMEILKEQEQTDEYWHAMELVRLYFDPDLTSEGKTYTLDEKIVKKIEKVLLDIYNDKRAVEDTLISLIQLEETI